ncbi:MAG TPA: chromate transporter [Gemmatimonadales bacterium]|nr:chromate transporter [Gemmatimonadales bacterium]
MTGHALRGLVLYFVRLGTFGFGGPIALAGYMQRDLVEQWGWVTPKQYKDGLALAQLAPGPLAAQLAIYFGWLRAGVLGATAVGLAFILPSFVMVLGLSVLYVEYGGLPWMRSAFYGVGAAVIAIIARSAVKLAGMTLSRDFLLWAVFGVNAVVTGWTETEIVWVFLLSGVVVMLIRAPPRSSGRGLLFGIAGLPDWLVSGLHGPAAAGTLWMIVWYFAEAGAVIFGSGLAIVPFLHGGVVERFGWLTERQFLDAIAVAMITPGPVVITVAFIGYLVAGPLGGSLAGIAVFLPVYLFTVLGAPYYHRFADNRQIRAFVDGVTAAAAGAIAGAGYVLGRRAITDLPTVAIALGTLVLLGQKRIPEPLLILLAGVAGLLLGSSVAES